MMKIPNLIQSPGQINSSGSCRAKQAFCIFQVQSKFLNHMIIINYQYDHRT